MAKTRPDHPKAARPTGAKTPAPPIPPTYEPPKLLKFEKLEKLIVSGE